MRILLDENVTPKAKETLVMYQHDVEHIRDNYNAGISDDEILKIAAEQERAILTHNGKHFVILIPPVKNNDYSGLIWLKFQVTNSNCDFVMNNIGKYFKEIECINNCYYSVSKSSESNAIHIKKKYPNDNIENFSTAYLIRKI